MNDPSNGNKRAILRSACFGAGKNACADGRLSLSAARASAVGLRGFRFALALRGLANPFSFRLDFLVRKSVYAAHRGRWSRSLVSAGSCRPARRRRAGQITRHDVRARAALFWIKEGRTGSEERFAFATRSAATN
jgi:hypothetical protein